MPSFPLTAQLRLLRTSPAALPSTTVGDGEGCEPAATESDGGGLLDSEGVAAGGALGWTTPPSAGCLTSHCPLSVQNSPSGQGGLHAETHWPRAQKKPERQAGMHRVGCSVGCSVVDRGGVDSVKLSCAVAGKAMRIEQAERARAAARWEEAFTLRPSTATTERKPWSLCSRSLPNVGEHLSMGGASADARGSAPVLAKASPAGGGVALGEGDLVRRDETRDVGDLKPFADMSSVVTRLAFIPPLSGNP